MKTMKKNELNVPAINITGYDHVAHLSYVDLDGFACSTLVHKAREGNVWQIGAQDRKGIDKAIEELVAKGKAHNEGTLLILITDLYLTKEQRAVLDAVNTEKVDVRVISCHYIGDYPSWYYTNTDVSATELLYTAIIESATTHIGYFNEFVKVVSAYDTLDRTNETLFASGSAIDNGMYMFLGKLKKDDDYTRDIVIEYLAEIANVVKGGIYDWTPTDIESSVIGTWRKAVGAIGTEMAADALARNLATRVLEDRSNRYNIKLDDVTYRCAVVGVLPFESAVSHEVLHSDVSDVDLIVSIDTDEDSVSAFSNDGNITNLFYKHFEESDIIDALICNDFYTAIEELGFVKAE